MIKHIVAGVLCFFAFLLPVEAVDDWYQLAPGIYCNSATDEAVDDAGNYFDDVADALEYHGYWWYEEDGAWIGEFGCIIDGEYIEYADDVESVDYCSECETFDGHLASCLRNPDRTTEEMEQEQEDGMTSSEWLKFGFVVSVFVLFFCADRINKRT